MAVIREYKEGDEIQLVDLYRQVFNRSFTSQEWRWKYRENPAGKPIISVAEEKDKIVGFYAVMPFLFEVEGKNMVFYQVTDSMVHPRYRHGTVFEKTAKAVIAKTLQRGPGHNNTIMYGFPYPRHGIFGRRFLGYKSVEEVCKFVRPLDAGCVERFIKNRYVLKLAKSAASLAICLLDFFTWKPKSGLDFEKINFFDNRIDDLCNGISRRHRIAVVRNSVFLNWRYVKKPANDYEIFFIRSHKAPAGYIVLKCHKGGGIVVDFMLNDRRFFIPTVKQVLDYFKRKGMKKALFFASPGSCRSALLGLGFFRMKSSGFILNIPDPERYFLDVPWETIRGIKNWFINFAELEL